MAGGPLNGANINNGVRGVVIPTAVRISSDFLQYWNSLTCLYDPQWIPESGRVTTPIAMFHVTDMREIGETQVSTKRVILYEPQVDFSAEELSKTVRPGVMRVVADNMVRSAKKYVINGILPFKPVSRYVTDGIEMMVNTVAAFSSLVWDSAAVQTLSNYTSYAISIANIMSSVADTMAKLPNMDSTAYINKNSIDAMWERNHFLCMKLWTGYEYKFVAITNIEIAKKATEDDVFRLTMQVQEMPVLTMNRPRNLALDSTVRKAAVKIVSAAQLALSQSLIDFTGVERASGSGIDTLKAVSK